MENNMIIITNFNDDIPKIYEQQRSSNLKIYARYFVANSDWEWLVLEYSKLQRLFFGLILPEEQLVYFTVEELQKVQFDYGVTIELDLDFKPTNLKEFLKGRVA